MTALSHRRARRAPRIIHRLTPARIRGSRAEHGYVAVLVALLLLTFVGLSAFSVDVGHWYLVGQQAQRAADAAALAGVTNLPGNQPGAHSTAQRFATANGFTNGADSTTVTSSLDGSPTRLRVTVKRTVDNIFGPLLGVARTPVTKTAVADYTGPVPMGSPCNEFGDDPDATSATRDSACNGTANFWANINAPKTLKQNGDPISAEPCSTSVYGRDGCSGSSNDETDPNGYFYTVSVKAGMAGQSLSIQIFDPVSVDSGQTCDLSFGSSSVWGDKKAKYTYKAKNPWHTSGNASSSDRYAKGVSSSYCTGDTLLDVTNNQQPVTTRFTVRSPSATSWDPLSFPVVCQRTFGGWEGYWRSGYSTGVNTLYSVLDDGSPDYRADVAEGWRQWVTICNISNAQVGDYLVQVQTNTGTAGDNANGNNSFGIRAIGSNLSAISVSGRERMGIFANNFGTTTTFYLARVTSGSAGGFLDVILYDVGDSNASGSIKIVPPSGGSYSGCTGYGVTTAVSSSTCSFSVPYVSQSSSSSFNGRYQVIKVPIPLGYTCNDADPTQCWVKLQYTYGSGAQPTDVTEWSAKLEGDPIRLVE